MKTTIITVTGLIGSGKTTLSSFFQDKGAQVISADAIGKEILQGPAKKQVIAAFGKDIVGKDRTIKAKLLAEKVFHDHKALHKLHTITHPYIKREIRRRLKKNRVNVIDAALYKDFDLHKISDYTVLIRAPLLIRTKRLAGVHTGADLLRRQRFQSEPKKPEFIVQNNGHIMSLKHEANRIWEKIVS